jgi:hypothetical protein
MTKEQAFKLFVKYGFKHYGGYGSKSIFDDAWNSQYWDGKDDHFRQKRDWMVDEVMDAFNWYLDQTGRDGGRGVGRLAGLISREELAKFEKDVIKECEKKQHDKWASENKARERRNERLTKKGDDFIQEMKTGDVWMVKFDDLRRERGILVMEIEPGSISGFYLDCVETEVPTDAPQKEGYLYTRPNNWRKRIKVGDNWISSVGEWDGKTFKRTRSYETKMAKFLKRKIENPIILK